jgi:hypothetical protein
MACLLLLLILFINFKWFTKENLVIKQKPNADLTDIHIDVLVMGKTIKIVNLVVQSPFNVITYFTIKLF